jgi:predicted nucleic acid-binding protein
MIIVDSNMLIEILDKGSGDGIDIIQRLEATDEEVVITSINLQEIVYGFGQYGKNNVAWLDQLPVLGFEKKDAVLAANIELGAERKGYKISRTDAMIAAMAINRNARLFTSNKEDFLEVPNLQLF